MISLETEKAFNDIRRTLIRRGVRRCEWTQVHSTLGCVEIHWLVDHDRLWRYTWRINQDQHIVEMVTHWLLYYVQIPLETESEKVERILDMYDI
jgi:hypothetical protein